MLHIPGVRREGSSMVNRLLPILLPALQPHNPTANLAGVSPLALWGTLSAAMASLPLAFKSNAKPLEEMITHHLMASGDNPQVHHMALGAG